MLFKVHSDLASGEKDFFEMNPGAAAIEAFNKCTSRQMFFVCLVADRDYDSPFRTLPENVRRERAVTTAGWPMEGNRPDKNGRNLINGKIANVEAAIAEYYKIQWDEDRAMLDAINAQIQDAIRAMAEDKEEKARVVKTTRNAKTGETSKSEYVDAKALDTLRKSAMALGAALPDLKEAKAKLLKGMDVPTALDNVTTYSSQDYDEDEDEKDDEEVSTLDRFNEKRKQQQDAN